MQDKLIDPFAFLSLASRQSNEIRGIRKYAILCYTVFSNTVLCSSNTIKTALRSTQQVSSIALKGTYTVYNWLTAVYCTDKLENPPLLTYLSLTNQTHIN